MKNRIIKIAAFVVVITGLFCVIITIIDGRSKYGDTINNPLIGSNMIIPVGVTRYSNETFELVDTAPDMRGKILVWIDSTKCAPCMLDYLYKFEEVDAYAHDSLGLKEAIFVVVCPQRKDISFFRRELSNCSFPFSIYVDTDKNFYRENPFAYASNEGPFGGLIPIYLLDNEGKVQSVWYSPETQPIEGIIRQGKAFLNMIRDANSKNRIMP